MTKKQAQTESAADAVEPLDFEWVSRARLKPWALNPNEGDVAGIAASIKQLGWGRPIVANRHKGLEGEIIIGHHALEAAELLGLDLVPVRWVNLPAKKAHALSLADNEWGSRGKRDADKLGKVVGLGELDPEDWMAAGFEEKEIKALMFAPWPDPKGDAAELGHQFSVIIECADEAEQVRVLEWCQEQELKCRALI